MPQVAIFNDTSPTRHYGCNSVMQALKINLQERGIDIAYYWPVGIDWTDHSSALRNISVDAIVVNGEGSIHDSANRPRACYLASLGKFAKEDLGVPSFLINATIDALDRKTLDDLCEFDAIHVRESRSQDYLSKHGIKSSIVPDLSFLTQLQGADTVRAGTLITDSVDRATRQQLEALAMRVNARFESMQARISWLEKRIKKIRKLVLFGTSEHLRKNLKPSSDHLAFVRELSAREAVITGRFHTVTLSILTTTPVYAIQSNTHKISSLLFDVFGNADRLLSMEQLQQHCDVEWLLSNAAYTDIEAAAIESYVRTARETASQMFDRIAHSVRRTL